MQKNKWEEILPKLPNPTRHTSLCQCVDCTTYNMLDTIVDKVIKKLESAEAEGKICFVPDGKDIRFTASNIVYQIGDELKVDVNTRQATNEIFIDFATKLIKELLKGGK